jgi:hypothetical protein
MKTSDTFNINRFGLMVKQSLIHNYRMLIISLVGFCGGLFMLLLIIQAMNEFETWTKDAFSATFITIFIATGLLYTGNSFPGLRTREKSYSYLLTPASALEKFLLELISRIVLFIVMIPLLYWVIFNAEGYLLQVLSSRFHFTPHSLAEIPLIQVPENSSIRYWAAVMPFALGLLIFTLPFAGTTVFMKYPLPKTLFSVAIIFFFHLFLVYFFLEILDWASNGPKDGRILGMDGEGAIKFFTIYAMVANVVLLAASYYKLKEREA